MPLSPFTKARVVVALEARADEHARKAAEHIRRRDSYPSYTVHDPRGEWWSAHRSACVALALADECRLIADECSLASVGEVAP